MPAAIPLIVYAAGTAAGFTAGTVGFWTIAASLTSAKIEQSRAKRKARDAFNDSLQDRLELIRSGVSAHKYIVGTCRVTGTLLYADSVGPDKTILDSVNALAANKCELVAHYLNEERVEIANFPGDYYSFIDKLLDYEERFTITGPVATVTLAHLPITAFGIDLKVWKKNGSRQQSLSRTVLGADVTITGPSGTYEVLIQYKGADDPNIDTVFKDGDKDQLAHSWGDITTPLWTSAHRARGICYFRTRYIWDEGKFGSRGAPQHGAILKGGAAPDHPFYDPRDGSAPAYTTNPAIIAGWWMTMARRMGAMGIPSDWIDWPWLADQANICDELVTVKKLDGSGYETIKRYECHAELSTDVSPLENLNIILSSMAGSKAFTAGKYRIFAGAFRAATFTVTDADVCGRRGDQPVEMQIATGGDISGIPNIVTATYANANDHWHESSPKPVANQDYIDSDGHETPLELSLPATTDERQANYLMGIALESGRPAVSILLPVLGIGEDISVGQTGQLNLSQLGAFSGRTFVVTDRIDYLDGTFDLQLREIRAQTYALDPDSWTPADPVTPSDASHLWTVDTPTGFVVNQLAPQQLPDYTAVVRLLLEWDPPAQDYVATSGRFQIRYRRVGEAWITAPDVRGDVTSTTITAVLEADDHYQFQLRAVNGIGKESNWVDVWEQVLATDAGANVGWVVDTEGKPAGVRGVENITNRTQIGFQGTALRIAGTPNSAVAYGFPAIPIDDTEMYTLTIRHRSSAPSASGNYLRFYELNAALPAGKTHVGVLSTGIGEFIVVSGTSAIDVAPANGPMPGVSLVTKQYTYTPTPGAKFASLSMFNWNAATAGVAYDVEWVKLTKQGSSVNLLNIGPGATGADGAGAFTLQNVGNMRIVSPTSATKTSANGWDGKVRTAEGFSAGAYISCLAINPDCGIGLTTDPSVDSSYGSVDYWFHNAASGSSLYVYRNGVPVSAVGTWAPSDRIMVLADDVFVRYLKNGVVLHMHPVNNPGETLFGVANCYYPDNSVTGISFGASGSAGDKVLIGDGNCLVSANAVTKAGGAFAWDSHTYSPLGYSTAHIRFKASQSNSDLMVGFNTDPLADQSYSSIDRGFVLTGGGTVEIYESGAPIGSFGSYTTATVFEMRFGAGNVEYYINGVLKRAIATTGPLFFDSSFYGPGGGINSLQFGPGTDPGKVDTGQIGDGATYKQFAGAGVGGSIFNPASFPQTIASITVPAQPYDATVVVSFEATFSVENLPTSGGNGATAYIGTAPEPGHSQLSADATVYQLAPGAGAVNRTLMEKTFSQLAGSAVTYNVYGFRLPHSGAGSVDSKYSAYVVKAEVMFR